MRKKQEKELLNNRPVQVVYEIGSTVAKGDFFTPDFYLWKQKELDFLSEFAKDLDPIRACQEVGYKDPEQAANKLLKNDAIRAECKAIYDARFRAMRMTSEMAAAKHLNLMDKIEKDYDMAGLDDKSKGSLANAMAKFSGDYLRASGLFGKEESRPAQVVINIDLGDKKEEKIIDVQATEV